MSPIHLSPLTAIHLSPNLAGGVRLSGCLHFICHPLKQFICLPVWLVVSGSPDVSILFVFPYSNSFVSQSGWWCPALRMSPIHLSSLVAIHFSQSGWWCPALWMSPIHLSPLIAIHLSPSLACGVRLAACLQFICLPLKQFICLPFLLVVSGSPAVSNLIGSSYSNSFVSQSCWWCPALQISPIHSSPLISIHLSPTLAGGVRLCLQFTFFPL